MTYAAWLLDQCDRSIKNKTIQISERFLAYTDKDGNARTVDYEPCGTFKSSLKP